MENVEMMVEVVEMMVEADIFQLRFLIFNSYFSLFLVFFSFSFFFLFLCVSKRLQNFIRIRIWRSIWFLKRVCKK